MSYNTVTDEIRPISPKALEKRIRRALAREGLVLQRTREGSLSRSEHGNWIVLAPRTGEIIKRRFELPELAVELSVVNAMGVLQ